MKLTHSLLAAGALTAVPAQAVLVASYNDGSVALAPALNNIAPAATGVTVSALSDLGAQTGDPSRITRTSFGNSTPAGPTAGSSAGSSWLEARSLENQGAPSSGDNYFVFTVSADASTTLGLNSLQFDLWVAPNTASDAVMNAEAFVRIDGGGFTSIGSITSSDTDGDSGVASAASSANFSLAGQTANDSIEVRIGIGYSQGNSGSISGFVQGIRLDADVNAVPEPSAAMLSLVGGLTLLRRKR